MEPSPVRRLETLLNQVDRGGLRSLSEEQLLQFGRDYRRTGALLARARTAGLKGGETDETNRLMARAYPLVHAAPIRRGSGLGEFLGGELPRAFRREFRFLAAAIIVFFLGAVGGAIAIDTFPDEADLAMGPQWRHSLQQVAERHVGNRDWLPVLERPEAFASIMTNNIRVSINTFVTGVLLCIGSFYILGNNGMMLGACAVAVHKRGVDASFWGFVAPHGVLEIPAILISGAAGILIGYAIIAPGRRRRADSLRAAIKRAVPLIMGVVLMLVVAALIEGFFSPSTNVEPYQKMVVAAFEFLCLVSWLAIGGGRSQGA